MALCCRRTGDTVKEFTFLLVRVLHVSHPAALEGSTQYAREIVDRFFQEHTRIDISNIEPHNHKFRNLVVESRLEIAFAGRHCEGLSVVFEVETRLIKRYIPPHYDFEILEVERTDYLPLSGCTQRQIADMRVSYMNA